MKMKSNYNKNIVAVVLLAVVFIGGFITINATKTNLQEDGLKISGLYGTSIKYEDIKDISLEDSLPEGLQRVSGMDLLGQAYLGNFKALNMDKVKLFVKSKKGPFIYITEKNNEYLIINYNSESQTAELFDKIDSRVNKKK